MPVQIADHDSKTSVHIVKRLLKYPDVERRLGVTQRTISKLIKTGGLPAIRFGRSVRFDEADLQAFVERSKCHAASGGPDAN